MSTTINKDAPDDVELGTVGAPALSTGSQSEKEIIAGGPRPKDGEQSLSMLSKGVRIGQLVRYRKFHTIKQGFFEHIILYAEEKNPPAI